MPNSPFLFSLTASEVAGGTLVSFALEAAARFADFPTIPKKCKLASFVIVGAAKPKLSCPSLDTEEVEGVENGDTLERGDAFARGDGVDVQTGGGSEKSNSAMVCLRSSSTPWANVVSKWICWIYPMLHTNK